MSVLLNTTKSVNGSKIDCAKECPCGVPTIPVPDQWLEVMVTGGFKVWHIIFIIIALVITLVVVYCCIHRCRIPRTKQEIEADLMRTNLATKFRDYLQEFPNEPTTFLEALKKVHELEERAIENEEDSGAKKRMGWLKLKGKEKIDKDGGGQAQSGEPQTKNELQAPEEKQDETKAAKIEDLVAKKLPSKTDKQSMFAAKLKEHKELQQRDSLVKPESVDATATAAVAADLKMTTGETQPDIASSKLLPKKEKVSRRKGMVAEKKAQEEPDSQRKRKAAKSERSDQAIDPAESSKVPALTAAADTKVPKVRKRRSDKPSLARAKATHHLKSRAESNENTQISQQLEVPPHEGRQCSRGHHHPALDFGVAKAEKDGKTAGPLDATIIEIFKEK